MNSDRFGVIAFFGILVPGSYLTGIFVFAIASILELAGLNGHCNVGAFVTQNIVFSSSVFFFISYLIGILIRLFAPHYVDNLSTFYLFNIRRDKKAWGKEVFPYKERVVSGLKKYGMAKIPEFMERLNPSYGDNDNTPFLNYCKWFIDANDPALSREVQEAEALVRFLSGTTLALLIALPLSVSFLVAFTLRGSNLFAVVYGGLFLMEVFSLCLILERFKYQRRREVIMVWSCVYLIVNGGTPISASGSRLHMIDTVFFSVKVQKDDSKIK